MSLKGKTAVVTGGAKGIGRACVRQLAKDGAAIAIWDLDAEEAQRTADDIAAAGGKSVALTVDASSAGAVNTAAAATRSALGPITILVNNAGITGFTPFMDISEEAWDRMIEVNLKGPVRCIKAVLPDMRAAGWGRIINISSSSAQTGAAAMAHYAASKGGVIGLSKALAMELAAENITVNNVPPGFIVTPMLKASPVDIDAFAATTPMKRPGQPEDIAAAVSYLASEAASYVTGHTLSVNGGRYSS